jgi:hypothetical protein
MMTKEQTELMTKTLADLRAGEAELVRDINVRVLDGTPFAIIGEFKSPSIEEPTTLIYGEWIGHGKCFRALSIQPNHFGGVYTMSATNADKAIEKLKADTNCKLINPRRLHIRDIKTSRLAELRAVIADISAVVEKEGGAL